MAKQILPLIWVKTIGIVSFYERGGIGYVRMKSNLTGERWRSDPAFEGSRRSAACMAIASKLASTFYQIIPRQQRYYSHYKELVGRAQHMLCTGYAIVQVNKVLRFVVYHYLRKQLAAGSNCKPLRSPFAATLSFKVKSVFKRPLLYQTSASQIITIKVGEFTGRWPIMISSRGSPSFMAGCMYTIQESISAGVRQVYTSGYKSCIGYPQWQRPLCPYLSNRLFYNKIVSSK